MNRNPPEGIRTNFSVRDLIVGGDAHRRTLEGILRKASSWVVIHSTFISARRFAEWLPFIREAIGRGTKFDILWGANPNERTNNVSKEVAACREMLAGDEMLERHVRLQPFSSQSHGKLLLADDGLGGVVGCVGSCNWLSTGFESIDVSVRSRDPKVVAEIASYLSKLARTPSGHPSSLMNELAGFAINLRRREKTAQDTAKMGTTMTFVSGAHHNTYVRRARDNARHRVWVASHRLSEVARTAVVVPTSAVAEQRNAKVDIYYGRLQKGVTKDMVAALSAAYPSVALRPATAVRLHAKVLAWDDDDVVLSSLNWLSSDPPDYDLIGEIGVHVRKSGVAGVVVERIEDQLMGDNGMRPAAEEY